MSIKIGHAASDENGKYSGGIAGDSTGREVCTRTWYNRPWNVVLRATETTIANKIAKAMEQACANNHIGYDQNQRTSLYTKAKAAGWDLSKITENCETDCSALVAVCVNCAGIEVSKDIYTGNERKALLATGKFVAFTDSKYLTEDSYLKRGDILLYEGHHTAIALENGSKASVKQTTYTDVTLPEIKKGDNNSAVLSLQLLLIHKWSISCGSAGADGDFGTNTENALKKFQQNKKLTADGVCGKLTWKALIGG